MLIAPVHWFGSFERNPRNAVAPEDWCVQRGDAVSSDSQMHFPKMHSAHNEVGAEQFLRGPLMIIWLWLMVTDGFQGTSFLTQSDRRPIIKWAFLLDSETKALLAVWTEVVDGGQGMPWFIVVWAGRTIFHSNMISRGGICLWKTRKCVEFKLWYIYIKTRSLGARLLAGGPVQWIVCLTG